MRADDRRTFFLSMSSRPYIPSTSPRHEGVPPRGLVANRHRVVYSMGGRVGRREHVAAVNLAELLGPGNYRRIAKEAGFTSQYISRFLRGQRGAKFATAKRIADVAGITLDQLWAYVEANRA